MRIVGLDESSSENQSLRPGFGSKFELPRERLRKLGVRSLSEVELLAILLGTGRRGVHVLEMAASLWNFAQSHPSLSMGRMSIEDFQALSGIGEAKASRILAAFEIGRRRMNLPHRSPPKLTSAEEAYAYLRSEALGLSEECFFLLPLDVKNRPLVTHLIAKGSQDAVHVSIRDILSYTLRVQAVGLIVAHNHPSGNPSPSEEDLKLTRDIARACKTVQIRFLDHLVICDDSFVSLHHLHPSLFS